MSKIAFDPRVSVIVVTAKITGNRSVIARLVLDTGASNVVVPWQLVNRVGIKVNPQRLVHITTASAVETVPQITIPKISVAGQTVKQVKAIVKDLPPESPVDGLLGLSFLRQFKLALDFQKGILTLT